MPCEYRANAMMSGALHLEAPLCTPRNTRFQTMLTIAPAACTRMPRHDDVQCMGDGRQVGRMLCLHACVKPQERGGSQPASQQRHHGRRYRSH